MSNDVINEANATNGVTNQTEANAPVKTYETIIFRVLWIVMLLIFCVFLFSFISDRSFVQNEMLTWQDAVAIVQESDMVGQPSITENTDSDGDVTDYEYRVNYYYIAEFEAWGEVFSFREEDYNSGRLSYRNDEIPKSAFIFPEPGSKVNVIFDPEAHGAYKLGSLEGWRDKTELTFANLAMPIIFGIVTAVLLWLDLYFRRRRKMKEKNEQGFSDQAGSQN
jgi:flagellar biosynthesis/type III secretory pathway M-ring protein FliF/YscJ